MLNFGLIEHGPNSMLCFNFPKRGRLFAKQEPDTHAWDIEGRDVWAFSHLQEIDVHRVVFACALHQHDVRCNLCAIALSGIAGDFEHVVIDRKRGTRELFKSGPGLTATPYQICTIP